MSGFRKVWFKGPRSVVVGKDQAGKDVVRKGKNGGAVIAQVVELHHVPKKPRTS